jgi:hypothetical protein
MTEETRALMLMSGRPDEYLHYTGFESYDRACSGSTKETSPVVSWENPPLRYPINCNFGHTRDRLCIKIRCL